MSSNLLVSSACASKAFLIILVGGAINPVVGAALIHPDITLHGPHSSFRGSAKDESRSPLSSAFPDDSESTLAQAAHAYLIPGKSDFHVQGGGDPIHTGKTAFWPPDQGNGLVAWIFAVLFVVMIASVPVILHFFRGDIKFTFIIVLEGLSLLLWLSVGLVCFTQVVEFQSPHFGNDSRTLTLVEAVYLFAQILTTVGYGDITPAHVGGQVIVGCFVLVTIILIAELISELSSIVSERAEKHVAAALEEASAKLGNSSSRSTEGVIGKTSSTSMFSLVVSLLLFAAMVLCGTCFFHFYPGEGKTLGQGVYMSIITLSTVGFGAFTADTEGGKVFASFWMVLGVASLGYFVTSFSEYVLAMREHDAQHTEKYDHAADDLLDMEFVNHHGRVDQVGYLRYALLKYHIAPKNEIDSILRQFQALDHNQSGKVSVEVVKQMSVSPTGDILVIPERLLNKSGDEKGGKGKGKERQKPEADKAVPPELGTPVLLPSSFRAGPRSMQQNYQDAVEEAKGKGKGKGKTGSSSSSFYFHMDV